MGGSDPHSSLDSESDFSFDSDEDSSDSVDDDIDFVCHFTERLLVNSAPLLMNIICSAKSSPVSQAVSAANREWETMSEKPSTTATQSDRKVSQILNLIYSWEITTCIQILLSSTLLIF